MKISVSLVALAFSAATLIGCAPANVSTNLREPSSTNLSMTTRCTGFSTGDYQEINRLLKQYDGWKVVYTSEYTTENKATTTMVLCFEKPYQ